MPTRESKVEKALRDLVFAKGGECLKFTSPGRRGAPDRIILMPGAKIEFCETKAKNGKLRPEQKRFHARLKELGFTVYVLSSLEVTKATSHPMTWKP